MPNIYLRLPMSRCQFFRNRDPKRVLAKNEPVVFSVYSPEYFVMRSSLTNAGALSHEVNTQCFSHQQWCNMLNGRHPLGGNVLVTRDTSEYLTYDEVLHLNGNKEYAKSDNEDYLCIKLPSEIEVIDTVRAVTPTWNLDRSGVYKLLELLNNDFKRSVVEWALATFDFCTANGKIIARSKAAMLERYLMRYGIDPSSEEKDNLRRVVERWIKSEHNFFKAYSCLDMQYEDRTEHEHHIDEISWLP
nr:MAG TPA: hypothetical protein [Bacteriophage sp.]